MHITKHFTLHEVSKSDTASRLNIDNTPSTEVIVRAIQLAHHILEPVREHFGIPFSPNSWFRCEELEKVITHVSFQAWAKKHGLDGSLEQTWKDYFERKSHPRGEAADIEIPGINNDDLYHWIRDESGLEFDQLIREFRKAGDPNSGWVHVSFRINNNRNQAFNIE